jgi:hypothetical protein
MIRVSYIVHKIECQQSTGRAEPTPVVPGGAEGAILADQLTLYQPGGGRLCPHITIGTPGFSYLPTVLSTTYSFKYCSIRISTYSLYLHKDQ